MTGIRDESARREATDKGSRSSPDGLGASSKTALVLMTDSLGQGDLDLGRKLMLGFLRTTLDNSARPWRLVLLNHGVRLATVDDVAIDALGLLVEAGVEVMACGTCLEHLGLTDRLGAGRVTHMSEIVETLNAATKVVTVG